MASLRSLAISLLRLDDHASTAAANRHTPATPSPLRLIQAEERPCPRPAGERLQLAGPGTGR